MSADPVAPRSSSPAIRGAARWTALVALVLGAGFVALRPGASDAGLAGGASHGAVPATLAASGDTQVVYGPARFETPTGSATYHVERFGLVVGAGRRYTLRVANGNADGSGRVTGGSVVLNGSQILSTTDLGSGASSWSRVVQGLSEDTIQVTVQGGAGASVTVSLLSTPDASFLVFGPERFIRSTSTPVTDTRHFTISATAAAPYRLCIVNGNADGTQRISSATIVLNGTTVLTQNELNQHVGGLVKDVTLQRDNTFDITLTAQPSGFLDLCFKATDVTPPMITIAQPPNNFITRENHVAVSGSVQDETATTVAVNGLSASMSGTSFSATVALSAEGNNVIHVVATDAAGHSTDSTRTVIHDTQAPVLTLTSPSDGPITKLTSVTVAGTVTDLTAVTVNVNGIPLPVDPTGAFTGSVSLTEGSNILTVTATDAASNATIQVRTVILDTHPPVLAVTAPATGLITNHTPVTVSGSVTDATAVTVTVNGTPVTVGPDGHFSGSVPLTEGSNTLTTVATDAAGNATTDTRAVTLDTHPPVLAVTAPTDGLITRQTPVTVSGTVSDATPVTVDVNGIPLPVDGAGVFTGQAPLSEGANSLTVTARDAATNTATVARIVTLDTQAPVIAVAQPLDGDVINAASVTTSGTVTDATTTTLTVNGNPVALGAGGAFSVEVPLVPNANTITYAATDAAGNSATTSITVTRRTSNLPPDPVMVASVVNRAEVTTIGANTSFLYSGATPIQTGVAAGTINPVRAAVLRGRVLDKTFAPLGGATVTILGHPELGQTLSRDDGGYDLAVNGGGRLTVSFVKDGYFPAQRVADVSWQDYTTLDDVILLQPDPAVTVVDLTSQTPPVARASVVSDADGLRQATLIFKPGNSAILTRPDGTQQPITSLSIRATEYTVGDSGELAMPAQLPPASQYTYAVQLSADEQLAAGPGAQVTFAQPVPFYVENFLHVPVGTAVPVGGYDATKGTWVPEPNGKVIKVLGKDANGRALVDITGDGQADPPSALAALGIDDYELVQLGGTYPAGSDLWRALAPRLEPEDLNFPFIFVGTAPTDGKVKAGCSSREGDPLRCQLQAQTAFQQVGIVGSPFTLNYASDRTQGNAADRKLDIALTGPTLQAQLLRVELEVDVAGKRFTGSFNPTPNLTYSFSWDGKDIYGRLTQGTQPATVLIGYVFPVQYAAPASATDAFGLPCAPTGTGSACSIIANAQTGARAERTLVQEIETSIGTLDATALGLGGFTLDVQNVYDPVGQVMYRGDGSQRATAALPPGIKTIIGNGDLRPGCPLAEGQSALKSCLGQVGGLAFGPDGSVYLSDIGNGRVRRVTPDGIITTVAGNPAACCQHRDGIPATQAWIGFPAGLVFAPDGSLYVVDRSDNVVRRVAPDGIISTVAGTPGSAGFAGDGGAATQAQLFAPWGLARGLDGSLYIGDRTRVRRVGPDGIITTVAGQINSVCDQRAFSACGDGGPATKALLGFISGDVQVGSDGTLYIMENAFDFKVRRVTPDGIIKAIAGNNNGGTVDAGDGGPATLASLGAPVSIALGPDGSFYIGEAAGDVTSQVQRVRRVTPNGIITTFAGTGVFGFSGDGGPAAAARLNRTGSDWIGVGPDGNLYIAGGSRIRKVAGFLPGLGAGQTVIASEDGSELYVFSVAGRQLFTLRQLTGDTLYRFGYDGALRLVSVRDRYGQTTQILRDATGRVTGVLSPDGYRTSLDLGPNGTLRGLTDPSGRTAQLAFDGGGLATGATDPNGFQASYSFDTLGRLTSVTEPDSGLLTRNLTGPSTLALTSSSGGVASIDAQVSAGGALTQTGTLPSGGVMQSTTTADGATVTRAPDGTVYTITRKPDPRFGMQVPLEQVQTRLPSGLQRTDQHTRTVLLTDSLNLLSVATQIDSVIKNGKAGVQTYDRALRRIATQTRAGRLSFTFLDSLGTRVRDSVPGFLARRYTFDAGGRLVQVTQGARAVRAFYGGGGLQDSTLDALGRTTALRYDPAGHQVQRIRPGADTVQWAYDSAGNNTVFVPPGRPPHRYTYTFRQQVESYQPPPVVGESSAVYWRYRRDGQLSEVRLPDERNVSINYDGTGRRATTAFGADTIRFAYDAVTGQLASLAGPLGESVAEVYDGTLLTQRTWSGPVSGIVTAQYDSNFRVASMSVNGTHGVAYGYDLDGAITSAGQLTVMRDSLSGVIKGTSLGQITTSVIRNGYSEDSIVVAQVGSVTLARWAYSRDNSGRVTGVVETLNGITATFGYAYDSTGRLTSVTKDGAAVASYEYGPNGNRVRAVTPSGVVTAGYDVQDRLLSYGSATYRHSATGEVAEKVAGSDTTRYTFDALGQLRTVRLPNGTGISYVYDGNGRRVGKRVNGTLVQGFLYSGDRHPVAELDATGAVVRRFVYATRADVPDFMIQGGSVYRILADGVGSVRLVVEAQSGAIAQQIEYDAFGRVTSNSAPGFQPFGFAGGISEPETGLVQVGLRFYEPETGRWISRDPLLFGGKGSNLYTYAASDPVNGVDRTGAFLMVLVLEIDTEIETSQHDRDVKRLKKELEYGAECVNGMIDVAFEGGNWGGGQGFVGCVKAVGKHAGEEFGKWLLGWDRLTSKPLEIAYNCMFDFYKGVVAPGLAAQVAGHEPSQTDHELTEFAYSCMGGAIGQGLELLAASKNAFYGPLIGAYAKILFHVSEKFAEATMDQDAKEAKP